MKTATLKTRVSILLAAGLLALAGFFSNAFPASAQDACPLPAGVTAPDDPRVTAQQVTGGSASLMDFTLAVRERSIEHAQRATAVEEGLYIGCAIRQDDGIWRSGDTYIVTLTLDGRVFIHAKDMSLSGGLLNPLIYGDILSELGVSPTDLANLASPDPAVAGQAFGAVRATLSQQPHASFDATAPTGMRPGIPGASGYAAVYNSTEFGSPIVLLAGFDLNASHVAEEQIVHRQPAVTARDVVDRATLKAFVAAAGEYFVELMESGDPSAAAQAKIALRDPNGPWIHGSVYLGVMEADTRLIQFHGGFPDRFELRRGGVSRDVVTGELIVDQLLRAANSGPEGGFWTYHFDDPADDSDSADIPKVGYAREFTGQLQLPGGGVRELSFIVNSGFYQGSPEVIAARQNTVIESVLPQVMRAMTASTVDAVSGRIERAISDTPPVAELSFGGASTLSDAILANGHALDSGTFDLSRLLANSSFTMPLGAADKGSGGLFGNLAFWGSGDYRGISGGSPQSVDYDGSVVSANLGVDTRIGADMLAGVSLAQTSGTVDYTASNVSGELTTSLTSINPYLGWQMLGGMNLWAMAGFGWGEVEIDDESAGTQASDLTQQMAAAGASGTLMSTDQMIAGGTTNLRLKGEVAFTSADVDGAGSLESTSLSASRQRLLLEGSHDQKLDSGATLTPSLELGLRNDGGDGETGTGIEAGGALRYADAESGLTVEGRVRTLLNHSGDYEETGVSGLVRIDPGASGQGLALSVEPAWGQTASGVHRLWENGVAAGASPADQATARLNAEIGYGLGATHGLGLVTPYTGLGLADGGARSWRMGARWQLAPAASLSVEGSLYEGIHDGGPAHGLMLRGALRW